MGLDRLTCGSVLRVIMSLLGTSGLPCLAIIRAQQIYYHKLSDGHCSVAALVAKLLGKECLSVNFEYSQPSMHHCTMWYIGKYQ